MKTTFNLKMENDILFPDILEHTLKMNGSKRHKPLMSSFDVGRGEYYKFLSSFEETL